MRLTLLTNSFAPYRVPQWNALGQLCDFSVVVLRRDSKMRQWTIDSEKITVPVYSAESPQLVVPRVDWELNLSYWSAARLVAKTAPDAVVISGYDSPGCWATLFWAKRNQVPAVLWCESNSMSSRTKGIWPLDSIKRRFIGRCDAFYVASESSASYLVQFGADRESIVIGNNSCDVGQFPCCERLGQSSEPVLLFVGQLIERKGLREMINALGRIEHIPWRLKIAGTGPLTNLVRQWAEGGGRGNRVELLGYVQQDRLSTVFRGADILLFPSLIEVYGLVLIEALASGLYIVGSDRCALSKELLKPGINGHTASPENPQEFAAAITNALAGVPYDRKQIRATVEHVTPEREAENMLKAARIAIDAHSKRYAGNGIAPERLDSLN